MDRAGPEGDRPVDDSHVGDRDLTVWRTRIGAALAAAGTRLSALLGPHAALLVTLLVAGVVVTALTGASAELYEQVSEGDGVAGFDRPVLEAALSLRSDGVDRVVTAFTDVGGPVGMPVLAVLATVGMTLAWRQRTPAVLMVAATAGSLAMTVVGKAVVGRTRPPLVDAVPPYETSASFPSGHALNAVVVSGVVAYLLVRRQHSARARALTITAAVLFATAMGLSRVFLGHHWLTDVLVAWPLGLAWLSVVVLAHRLFLTAHRRGVHAPTGTIRSRAGTSGP